MPARTSKSLAKLAADYLNLTKEELLYKSVVSPGAVIADIRKLAASAGDLFEASLTGTNPDIDNKFNMWFTGGALNVKNRLGGTYYATVLFVG